MTYKFELYKCNICGNLIEVLLEGVGELVCCGQPMEQLEAKQNDTEYGEKHVPVIDIKNDNEAEIRVGSAPHPMVDEHYIQFIETISNDGKRTTKQFLYPNEQPIMYLKSGDIKTAREYCNIHGLWEAHNS